MVKTSSGDSRTGKENTNHNRAERHLLISAKKGHKDSLEGMKKVFMTGLATKEQYAEALKGYQVAMKEIKSHDRDEKDILGQ